MLTYNLPKERKNGYISLLLSVTGLLFFLISSFVNIYPYLFQLIGLAFLVFAIQIMQRYVLSDFVYIIDDHDNGDSFLNVIKIQGGKKTTVCSVSLIKCIFADDYDKITLKPDNSFDYRQNVFSQNKYALLYNENEDNILITLEVNDSFKRQIALRVSSK